MKRKNQILGIIVLLICSVIYDFQKPEAVSEEQVSLSYVILEGEFLKTGKYEFEGEKTVGELIKEVGVSQQANLKAVNLTQTLIDESRLYLPPYSARSVSLNQATKEELMTLKGVGEKTAEKIIEYRTKQPFHSLEDIMNISGIGEKTYLRLREDLCL